MQQHSKLSTPIALQVFSLLKSHLVNFNLGQPISTEPTNTKPNNRPPAKYSFNYILNKMASSKPKFLTDFILEANPEFDKSNPISFKVLVETLKGLLSKFTTVLFTQLDYLHILRLHYSIPPYSANNRKKVAINMACLHLYLNHTYKTINFEKFMKKLDIKPLHFTLNFDINYDADKLLFDIQNDNRFNIKVKLNISAKKFEDDFKIPSLKPHTKTYETWFQKFFEKYKIQFEKIDQQKTSNYIKMLISQKLIEDCKELLPETYSLSNTLSTLQERSKATFKAALHHFYKCNNKSCNLLL
jgi:hypothetical protein